jgi:hypothetical protein
MKKLLALLLLLPMLSFGQIIIDQSVKEAGPYKVGDTITIEYRVNPGNLDVNYLWLRYVYHNNAIEMIPNSTVFSQGESTQVSYYHWNNYNFTSNPNIGVGELLNQYRSGGWQYSVDTNWNVAQLTIQRTDASISGLVASQKYKIKDYTNFDNMHKLSFADATTRNNVAVTSIGSTVLWLDLNSVSRLVSSVKFKVAYPANYDMTKHNIQIMETDANGVVNWASQPAPAFIGPLDSSGELVTDKLRKDKKYLVMINPAFGQNVPDNIITVTDAYKAFKAITDRGINIDSPLFATNLEKIMANVTQDQNFDSQDAYYLFAKVMGVDLSAVQGLMLPTTDMAKPVKFLSGFTSTFKETPGNAIITPTNDNETYNLSYAWAGDLDFSHSSPLSVSGTTSTAGKQLSISAVSAQITSTADTSISTALVNGKVVVTVGLNAIGLAGAEYKIGYDDSKLKLDDVTFDTGNDVTNFSTHKENIITFGSMDKSGAAAIKQGTPYKLIFTPKEVLTNASGLIYTYFAEAVDKNANKVILNIK